MNDYKPLPVNYAVRRRLLRKILTLLKLSEQHAHAIHEVLSERRREVERLLMLPVGTLVRQEEHRGLPKEPWVIAVCNSYNYTLMRIDGKLFQKGNRMYEELYVYPEYVVPLREQGIG